MRRIKFYHWNGDESAVGPLVMRADYDVEVLSLRDEIARLRAEADVLRAELSMVLEWAITEKKPLRDQEIRSIRKAMGADA